ncbi:hypothetical protein ACFFX0_08165 [Citricoccus parietis]|uniref:Uncharacterized protein n=1 Tax=Citricoccus parietis TaxID=592307 RepID=A0ABV5FX12_9MICC
MRFPTMSLSHLDCIPAVWTVQAPGFVPWVSLNCPPGCAGSEVRSSPRGNMLVSQPEQPVTARTTPHGARHRPENDTAPKTTPPRELGAPHEYLPCDVYLPARADRRGVRALA